MWYICTNCLKDYDTLPYWESCSCGNKRFQTVYNDDILRNRKNNRLIVLAKFSSVVDL